MIAAVLHTIGERLTIENVPTATDPVPAKC